MELKYGAGMIQAELDSARIKGILIPPAGNGLTDLPERFHEVLAKPTAGQSLVDRLLARKPARVAVIVEDKTRKNPEYPIFLSQLITYIQAIYPSEILLIIAYGSHPHHTPAENEQLYGRENLARVTVINHDARDESNLVNLGALSSGNVLMVNKAVAGADFVISFGDITPHGFAGFSGGRKAILPGVSGFTTIERNHTLVSHSGTGLGKLDGNLLHLEMLEAASKAGLDFIINWVRNSAGEIMAMVSGDHRPAFAEGVRRCREINSVKLHERADAVLVSCGGFPKDKSLYHAQRAIIAAVNAVKQGGSIAVFGQFPEGVGDGLYQTWLQKPLPEIMALPPAEIRLGVHSAYLMARNLTWADIILVTDMDAALATALHFRKLALNAVARFLVEKHSPDYQAYIIPNGSQILPEMEGES